MTVRVRAYEAADRATLLALVAELQECERHLRTSRAVGGVMCEAYVAAIEATLLDPAEDVAVFVAVAADAIVGFLHCAVCDDVLEAEPAEVIVRDMMVLRPWRRRGLGRRLLDAAHDFAAAHGVGRLVVSVLTTNAEARAAYAALGFAEATVTLEMLVAADARTTACGS
jgi:GNAT superfamily N-acetyltransferase